MKQTHRPRDHRRCPAQLTATALGAALLVTAFAAQAQEAQTVTVTGIRKGIEDAISVKKNADGVVEAISAEDIGKLPDTTIAESLGRLPGLSAQRDAKGNATNINIRGFGPDFSGYTLNGREQTSTTSSRAVDLSVYPAELIAGATVYKSADASLMTAGLAGTIDQKLIDPLAFGSRIIAGSVSDNRYGVGLPVTGDGKRYTLSYVDQFADRKLGVALGFVHSEATSNALTSGSWGSNVNVVKKDGTQLTGVAVPWAGGLSYESDHNSDKRDGLAAILNFKPNKDFESSLDLYFAKIKTGTKKAAVKRATNYGGITISDAVVDSQGVVQSGTFTMNPGSFIAYNENIVDDDTLKSIGWKNKFNLSDRWKATVDLSHNSALRKEKDVEAYGMVQQADTMSFTNGGAAIPQFKFGTPSLYTDPSKIMMSDSGWSGIGGAAQDGYLKGPTIKDKLDAVRLSFNHELGEGGLFTDVEFGGNLTRRSKDYVSDEALIVSSTNGGFAPIPYPSGSYIEKNVGNSGLDMLTFDPTGSLWAGATLQRKYNNDILSKTWKVEEKVTTAYVKANFESELASLPVRGNLGAQLVHTDQSSEGFRAGIGSGVVLTNPAGALSTAGKTYYDVLPSGTITADLGGGQKLRGALGIQIARPLMTDMRNSLSATVDTDAKSETFGLIVGSAGNPQLKPFKAKALDVSYEKYFGNKAYFAAAGFYKKLDTYIATAVNSKYDFTQVAKDIGLTVPPAGAIGSFTQPVNGNGGEVRGIEVSGSLPLNMAHDWLDGFSLAASGAGTDSSVKLPDLIGQNPTQGPKSGPSMPLPGLSRSSAKLMLSFERAGFSAFVAQTYRSKFVGYVNSATVGGYPSPIYINPQSAVSAQIGYEIQTGTLKGLSLRLEGNNLNKPVYKEIKSDGTVNASVQTGATYGLRLSYKFQ